MSAEVLKNFADPLKLVIDAAAMQAVITYLGGVNPAFHEGEVYTILANHNVLFGIDKKLIQEFTAKVCAMTDRQKIQMTLAKGNPAEKSIDGSFEFFITDELEIKVDDVGRADFRNIRRYKTVTKGQRIARIVAPYLGKDGMDIHGVVVKAREPSAAKITPGNNLTPKSVDDRTTEYYASIDGIFWHVDNTFYIEPDLIIEGNAGLETGNLSYDLSIIIKGNIERGTEIITTKDLTVEGLIESGQIKVGGTLSVAGGINAAGKGQITVGRDLTADFIENSRILCDGSVVLHRSILNSTVVAHGTIDLNETDNSVIAGGEIVHLSDLKVARIGNQNEIVTTIYPALHYHNQQLYQTLRKELETLDKEGQELVDYLRNMKQLIATTPAARISPQKKQEAQERVKQYHSLIETINKKRALYKTVFTSRYNSKPVKVYIKDIVLPGTEFHFRGNIEKIKAPMKHVVLTFYPDRSQPGYEPHPDN